MLLLRRRRSETTPVYGIVTLCLYIGAISKQAFLKNVWGRKATGVAPGWRPDPAQTRISKIASCIIIRHVHHYQSRASLSVTYIIINHVHHYPSLTSSSITCIINISLRNHAYLPGIVRISPESEVVQYCPIRKTKFCTSVISAFKKKYIKIPILTLCVLSDRIP